ncbi:ATP-binding protein [Sphingomonas sp. KR1UV-12]|uniref:histidine kinase n=1 Tax=Sphingomonas aurea TaxID=3063994 RepID=A0ABT9EK31_9SPHN|nr:ATP-binding protein [Sphingomonas sp. KR1UV-12]MDP1027311.1 ATP-binding protein [Sphingomonas sp. KR1UV-12]
MMDAPLLALTRPLTRHGVSSPDGPSPEATAADNMRQLVQLRWLAVGGQLVTILLVRFALGVPLPLAPMLIAVAALAVANLASLALLPRHRVTNGEIMAALLVDMGVLTVQLYLSGGAANPFVSLYLLQVVLGAILLRPWSAWVLIAATGLCYAGLTVRSLPLVYPRGLLADTADLYTLGAWISFLLIATLLVMFIGRITRNLHARDRYLSDLRQHAAEEDGIVRMGLFASGAAHELGTPLASLAVILSDWRRMPRIAGDPELAGEVQEMQGEVERCKRIVSDILHSAGEPRGEAMESVPAGPFLDTIVAEWRATQPAVPLDYTRDLAGAALVAGASLRQAIWNLLDNAAEFSPGWVELLAERQDGELAITVLDRGRGFGEAQLAGIGKAYQSSKGAGHGLGLFLASNVARRLGGRLEASNRDGSGAAVSLILPLVTGRGERG